MLDVISKEKFTDLLDEIIEKDIYNETILKKYLKVNHIDLNNSDELYLLFIENPNHIKVFNYIENNIKLRDDNDMNYQLSLTLLNNEYINYNEAKNSNEYFTQLEAYLELIKGSNIFLTGPGGAGKSHVINTYCDLMISLAKSNNKTFNIAKTALSGTASQNINGNTIQSLYTMRTNIETLVDFTTREEILLSEKSFALSKFKNLDVLVIDEISMMSVVFFDNIIKLIEESGNKKIQLIISGDFSQLEPIGINNDTKKYNGFQFTDYEIENGSTPCYKSKNWDKYNFKYCYLGKNYRAGKDLIYSKFLTYLSENDNKIFVKNLIRNSNVKNLEDININDNAVILSYSNKRVEELNTHLQNKNTNTKTFSYTIDLNWVPDENISSKLKMKQLNENKKILTDLGILHEFITFKVGDKILFRQNISVKNFNNLGIKTEGFPPVNLTNGTVGTFMLSDDNEPGFKVATKSGYIIYWFTKMIDKENFDYNENNELEVTSKITWYPFILGYALTLHKSQGQTLNNIIIDSSSLYYPLNHPDIFNNKTISSLFYVGVSRCTNLQGLNFLKFIPNDNHIDKLINQDEDTVNFKNKTKLLTKDLKAQREFDYRELFKRPYDYILKERLHIYEK